MDLDAKLAADTLRKMADFKQMLAFPHDTGKIIDACADLIESLAAENELLNAAIAVTGAIECERDAIKHELEQVKRERDAAVKGMAGICRKHNVCDGCKNDDAAYIPNDCIDCANACNWQWRGVKEGLHEP